jgi:hypothetical protein
VQKTSFKPYFNNAEIFRPFSFWIPCTMQSSSPLI